MLNQVNDAIKRSARLMVLRHPMAVDVLVSRKRFTRAAPSDSPPLLGGATVLGGEDEADYELETVGTGKMLFLGKINGSEFAANGLDYGETEISAYIEPAEAGAFEVRKKNMMASVIMNAKETPCDFSPDIHAGALVKIGSVDMAVVTAAHRHGVDAGGAPVNQSVFWLGVKGK